MNDIALRLKLGDFGESIGATLEALLDARLDQLEALNIDYGFDRDELFGSADAGEIGDSDVQALDSILDRSHRNSHPLPVLLNFGQREHPDRPEVFQLIVARSVELAIELAAIDDLRDKDIVMICRRARLLVVEPSKYAQLMTKLPDFTQPFDDIADGIQALSEDPELQDISDRLHRWASIIRTVADGRAKRKSTLPGAPLRVPGCVTEIESSDYDLVIAVAEPAVDTAYPNAPEETQHDRPKDGASAYIQTVTTSKDRADGMGHVRGEQIVNRQHMESNCPSSLHSQLTNNEAKWAFGQAYRMAATSSGYLFAALAIVTGRRIEHLKSLPLVTDQLNPERNEYWFHRNGVVALWYRARLPQFVDLMKLDIVEQSSDEGIALPLPPNLAALLLKYLARTRQNTSDRDAAEAVAQLAASIDKRVTAPRLSKVLSKELTLRGVDEVDVAWLSGMSARHCAGLYYSVIPRARLLQTYYDFVDDLMASTGDAWPDRPPLPTGDVGTRIRVRDELVTRVFSLQADSLTAARQHPSATDRFVFHNRYVLYTFQVLALACGIRAVTEPFGNISDTNPFNATLRLLDKANRGVASDRMITLGEIALAQIRAYNRHLTRLAEYCRHYSSALRSQVCAAQQSEFSWLFRIDHKERAHPLRPRWILRELRHTWPLPINWPRHFHSSWLREQGFGRGVIRAYLGHADSGAAPLSRFDGTSMFELRQLGQAINDRLVSLGIRAVR